MVKRKYTMDDEEMGASISDGIKGFDSLLENGDSPRRIVELPLSRIEPNEKNMYAVGEIEQLADLIKDHGQIQPITVLRTGAEAYRIVSGERRYEAMKLLQRESIEAIVYEDLTPVDEEILLISANAYRTKTELERAREISRLAQLFDEKAKERPDFLKGRSVQQAVADHVHTSSSTITRALRLDSLIPELKEKVEQGLIGSANAQRFASFPDGTQQDVVQLLEEMEKNGKKMSRGEAVGLSEALKQELEVRRKEVRGKDREIQSLHRQLRKLEEKVGGVEGSDGGAHERKKNQLLERLQQAEAQLKRLEAGEGSKGIPGEEILAMDRTLAVIDDHLDAVGKHLDSLKKTSFHSTGADEKYRRLADKLKNLVDQMERI